MLSVLSRTKFRIVMRIVILIMLLSSEMFYISANANSVSASIDTVKKTSSEIDDYFIDRSKNIVFGLAPDFKSYKLTFGTILANLIGDLYSDYDNEQFNNSIITWKFAPSINQFNVTAYATTRYGSFGYSKSIPSGLKNQSSYKGFNFAIPYKKLTLSFDYFKFTGNSRAKIRALSRTNPRPSPKTL